MSEEEVIQLIKDNIRIMVQCEEGETRTKVRVTLFFGNKEIDCDFDSFYHPQRDQWS